MLKKYALNLINFVSDTGTGKIEEKYLWCIVIADNKSEARKFAEKTLIEDFEGEKIPLYELTLIK